MLKLIIKQSSWGVLGHAISVIIGFFITRYVFLEVGEAKWGQYKTAHDFAVLSNTFLSIGIPSLILRFLPNMIDVDKTEAKYLISKILRYSIVVSVLFILFMIFFSQFLDHFVWNQYDNFYVLLFFVSIHAPISMFMGIIISLFRSVLKIKEILLYGTFISVPLRAVLTFIVFTYYDDILYFVFIEIFTQIVVITCLFYLFNKNEFKIFNFSFQNDSQIQPDIYNYGKSIYLKDIITFLSTTSLPILMSFFLPAEYRGIYAVLLTITAIIVFLNRPLRQIFAPAISKLFEKKEFVQLDSLYKTTTFLVNFLTIPMSLILITFSDEFLGFFSRGGEFDILYYKPYLFILIFSRMLSLVFGQTGTFMIMAGLEKKELYIQVFKSIFILLSACIFIPIYKLDAVVTIFISLMLFENIFQLFYLRRSINISPFSKDLIRLILITFIFILIISSRYFQKIDFTYYYFSVISNYRIYYLYFIIPFLIYFLYSILFINKLRSIYNEIK